MTRPDTHATTSVVYDWLGPGLTAPDDDHDWALLTALDCYGVQQGVVDDIVRYKDGRVGWASSMDPATVGVDNIGWLGQFVGVVLPADISEADARDRVANPAGVRRGRPAAIERAIAETLVGGRVVTILERDTSAYHYTVKVYSAEMPDQAVTEAALQASKPGGLIAVLELLAGWTWADVVVEYATWADVAATYPTWEDVIEVIP